MKTYKGRRIEDGSYSSDVSITIDGVDFEKSMLEESLKLRYHSPTGFNWGYSGSGPHQLALALLLHVTNDPYITESHYGNFVMEYVSQWGNNWEITDEQIKTWVASKQSTLN